ncbi:GNAT family N-acetyltransferase [Pseudomonas purpurea]|uniref:GNAT family N-acetyltransferase n=1 Tax=Pseudomonas purpurea TaxID=3136737 RepID=UPI0032649BE2
MHALHTPRLLLNPLAETDWPIFLRLHQQPDVMRYVLDELSPEHIRERFDSRLPHWSLASSHWLCLTLRDRQTSESLGVTGLRLSDHTGTEAEVGYLLLHQHHGKGYGSESLSALTTYATQTLGIDTLQATVTDGNAASCKVLEKCGFVFSERKPLAYSLANEPVDDLIYRFSVTAA